VKNQQYPSSKSATQFDRPMTISAALTGKPVFSHNRVDSQLLVSALLFRESDAAFEALKTEFSPVTHGVDGYVEIMVKMVEMIFVQIADYLRWSLLNPPLEYRVKRQTPSA
jgi:hypothetical protein